MRLIFSTEESGHMYETFDNHATSTVPDTY